jgi:hypothetical protein
MKKGNSLRAEKLTDLEKRIYQKVVMLALAKAENKNPSKIDDSSIEYVDEGGSKAVYKVNAKDSMVLALAASRENGNDFLIEIKKLKYLYSYCPDFFPRPLALVDVKEYDKKVLFMEYLNATRIDKFRSTDNATDIEVAKAIGYSAGYVFGKTKMFTVEPHNGNILLCKKPELFAKFVDVDHFVRGKEYQLYEDSFMHPMWGRDECINNKSYFESSFDMGLKDSGYDFDSE